MNIYICFYITHRRDSYTSNECKYGNLADSENFMEPAQARRCLLPQLVGDSTGLPLEDLHEERTHASNDSLFVNDEQDKLHVSVSTGRVLSMTDASRNELVRNSGKYKCTHNRSNLVPILIVQNGRLCQNEESVCYSYCRGRMCCNRCWYPTTCKIDRCKLSNEICITAAWRVSVTMHCHLNANASTELK